MSIRNNHAWVIAGVIFLAALFFLLRGSYFVDGGNTWPTARQSGSSLNGYWYLNGEGGCFDNKRLVFIDGDRVYIISGEKIGMLPQTISKHGSGYVFTTEYSKGSKVNHYVDDFGGELFETRTQAVDNQHISNEYVSNKLYLTTCDRPTAFGYFKSLFYKVLSAPVSPPQLPQNPMKAHSLSK